jgi:hypothetical protein
MPRWLGTTDLALVRIEGRSANPQRLNSIEYTFDLSVSLKDHYEQPDAKGIR